MNLLLDQNMDHAPVSFLIGHNKNIILKAKDVSFFEKSQSLSLSSPVLVQNKGNVFTKKKKKKECLYFSSLEVR